MQNSDFDLKKAILEHKSALIMTAVCILAVFLLCALVVFAVLHLDSSQPQGKEESETPTTAEKASIIKNEIRGVYIASVHNLNFPSAPGKSAPELQAELDGIVSECVNTGFNTIYFQVRPSADALYDSDVFPTSRFLVVKEGDEMPLDPLSYLVEKASQQGIDVVAWVNPYRVTTAKFDTTDEALLS